MENMKRFNLEEYLKNPNRKIITRDNHSARVVCTDQKGGNYPVIALVQKGNKLHKRSVCRLG